MFIKGLKYITPCQSRFSKRPIADIVTDQFSNLSRVVQGCLDDHGVLAWTPQDREALPSLKRLLHELQSKKLSGKLAIRVRTEHAVVKSITHILHRRPDIVVRQTDKSKVFYVGNAVDFKRKASEYMLRTQAYQEISNGLNPLAETLQATISLLHSLLERGAINQQQFKRLSPNRETLELAHLYFIPKTHKVTLLTLKSPVFHGHLHSVPQYRLFYGFF